MTYIQVWMVTNDCRLPIDRVYRFKDRRVLVKLVVEYAVNIAHPEQQKNKNNYKYVFGGGGERKCVQLS